MPKTPVNILLVDDQPEGLITLEAILGDLGQNLFRASSGREALKQLLHRDFAVILLDVAMPEMDGFETAQLIRQRDKSKATPIIFLTAAFRSDEQVFRGYSAGAVDYMVKPVVPEILRSKVSVFVELKQQSNLIRRQLEEIHRAEIERSRMNAELLQGQKLQALGQLAAGMAHEINNPISFVISNVHCIDIYCRDLMRLLAAALEAADDPHARSALDALRAEVSLDGVRRELRGAIDDSRQGAERVRDIVRRLSRFTYVDEGQTTAGDVNAILEEAVRICSPEMAGRIEVQRDLGTLPQIHGYPQLLGQVFLNILLNAAQAIPRAGQIRVSTRHEDGCIAVRIRDSGEGIDPDHMKRIFEPFFTTKPVGKGTGLGLHVARIIVQAHQGVIQVASEPGRGAEFTVRLPVRAAMPSAPRPSPPPEASGLPTRRHTVVCVDDEAPVLETLRRVFHREPVELLTTADPHQALAWVRSREVSIVIADQRMPGMAGSQLLEEVGRQAPLVARMLLTGYMSDSQVVASVKEGGIWLMGKPWDDDHLIKTIRKLLTQREVVEDSKRA